MEFNQLLGCTFSRVKANDVEICFECVDKRKFVLYHEQNCCENVYIESIVGDLNDLIGTPITFAEESYSDAPPPESTYGYESYTWTFYKLATKKGYVDIRFFGSSNGYYGESAVLREIK